MVARSLSAPLQVFERTPDVTVVLHDLSTLICVWRGTPSVAAFRRIEGYLEQTRVACLSARAGASSIGASAVTRPAHSGSSAQCSSARFAVLVIIEPSHSTPPDAAARQENARITSKYENDCLGVATVLEGGSLKHSLIRFAIATMQLMSSSPVPQAIFDSVRDANMWFAKLSPETHSVETILAVRHARDLQEHKGGTLLLDSDDYAVPASTTIDRRNAR
jgi:hypothetical protein